MMDTKKALLTAAALSGLIMGSAQASGKKAPAKSDAKLVKCEGVNKCSGKGACGSKDGKHKCAGTNECKGKGWIKTTAEECEKLQRAKKKY
jgi:uncharacterized membrane protein